MDNKHVTDTYLRLKSRLKSMASSILKNEDDADDALQEAFCKICTHSRDDRFPNADGLAIVAVKRVCLSYLRKRSVQSPEPIDENSDKTQDSSKSIWEENEMREITKRLLSKLNPLQRSVFEMISEGVDYDIIAIRLGISEDSVRQNICRARKILRNEYRKL